MIVACDGDSATLLAVTVVRSVTPEVPVIACVTQQDSVTRILQAGADSAFSVSEVTGQLLAHYVLDQVVSQQGRIKLSRVTVSERMSGRHPGQSGIRERSGCTVIAMERDGEVDMEMPETLRLQSGDAIYICGTANAFERFYREFG